MRNWVLLFLASLLSISGGAQKTTQSLLWEISGNGLKSPSYLFGTSHIICASDFNFTPVLAEKIKSSKKLFLEIDLSKPNMQQEMLQMMQLEGTTLDKLLGSDFETINTHFQKITGASLKLFNQFKPFIGVSMLTLKTVACNTLIQPETVFMKSAEEAGIAVGGLETVSDQVAAINSQPLSDQITEFKKMVTNFDSVKLQMNELIKVYKLNDVERICQFMQDQRMTEAFEQTMLIKRNKNWIPSIINSIQIQPTFFAVGAAHLGGKEGVIDLLKEKGYQLTPVKY
ncbi:TraB/GumN family protein [Sediminibacterium sp.]|uniref:TraB/GumN family protein n=1 Tax=Sediminibacterium sp. TaxID=1917865 RepID=UPI003F7275AE